MLKRIVKWFRRKRNWRRTYIVHLNAFGDFDLIKYIEDLKAIYKLTVISGMGTQFQSIEIRIRPRQLREMEKKLPDDVIVSSELKEPGKR